MRGRVATDSYYSLKQNKSFTTCSMGLCLQEAAISASLWRRGIRGLRGALSATEGKQSCRQTNGWMRLRTHAGASAGGSGLEGGSEAHSSVVHLSVICWQKSEMPALCRLCSEGPSHSAATLGLGPDSWAGTQPDPLPFPPGKQGLWPSAGGAAGGPSGKLRIGGNTRAPSEVLLSFSEIKNESGQSEAEYLASI